LSILLPFTLPVKFRQAGDTAALGMDYQLRGKLAFVTAGAAFVEDQANRERRILAG
jgi:hypothetical protein